MWKLLTVCLCYVFVAGCSAQAGCDCFPVTVTNTTLKELILHRRLYTQAPSNSSIGAGLDSVCISLTATYTPDNALVEMVNLFTNKTVLRRASIQTTIKAGSFLAVGPTRSYKDFILGNPCPGTYVIYRCVQTGSCVTDISKIDVFVASTRPRELQSCIDKGLAIIQKNFPGLKNFILPRTICPDCKKTILVSTS